MAKTEIVGLSRTKEWAAFRTDETGEHIGFFSNKDGNMELLKTPGGEIVTTIYEPLAHRILDDLDRYGYYYSSLETILSWHFTLVENFKPMEHERVEQILDDSFMSRPDWTTDSGITDEKWLELFGRPDERRKEIREWLSKCTHMQMTAACCIGNGYHTINLAFVMAMVMENFTGTKRELNFARVAGIVGSFSKHDPEELLEDMHTFELYYGIHLEENGPIINKKMDDEEGDELSGYIGRKVSVEDLVGRNYYHYTDGIRDVEQPYEIPVNGIDLDTEDKDWDDDDEDEPDDRLSELAADDCWIKRIPSGNAESTAFILIAVTLCGDGTVEDVSIYVEHVEQFGGGMFYIPGQEIGFEGTIAPIDFLPGRAKEELEKLFAGRCLRQDTTFIGKPVPESLEDESYCQESAFRLAYMDVSLDVEDGIITGIDYSTGQTTGNAYQDMFMRPHYLTDRKDEALDMMLYMLDQYSDEEYEKLFR